jgi:predicted phosphodiesterase
MQKNARLDDHAIDSARPVLIFGGPYSNLQATQAMIQTADAMAIPASNIFCTGDVVAYAAAPEETAQLVRSWGIHVVAGNCEEQLAAGAADCGCGFEEGSACDLLSKGWYPYANGRVSTQTRAWMSELPSTIDFTCHGLRFHMLHGGVNHTNRFIFGSQTDALAVEASELETDVVLAGHAGIPFIARAGRKTWLNAGVIGVPANDGTADGWYALAERATDCVRLSLHRLSYDHNAAAAAMRRSGHANGYARTLITGIWPSHDVLPEPEKAATGKTLSIEPALIETSAVTVS